MRLYNISITLWIFLVGAIIFGFVSAAHFNENNEEFGAISSVIALGLIILFVVGLFRSEPKSSQSLAINHEKSKPVSRSKDNSKIEEEKTV